MCELLLLPYLYLSLSILLLLQKKKIFESVLLLDVERCYYYKYVASTPKSGGEIAQLLQIICIPPSLPPIPSLSSFFYIIQFPPILFFLTVIFPISFLDFFVQWLVLLLLHVRVKETSSLFLPPPLKKKSFFPPSSLSLFLHPLLLLLTEPGSNSSFSLT